MTSVKQKNTVISETKTIAINNEKNQNNECTTQLLPNAGNNTNNDHHPDVIPGSNKD